MSAENIKTLRALLAHAAPTINNTEDFDRYKAAIDGLEAKLAKPAPGRPGEGHTLAELAKDPGLAGSLAGRKCWIFNLATRRYRGIHPEKPVDKRVLAAFFTVPAAVEVLGTVADPENWFLELAPAKGGGK